MQLDRKQFEEAITKAMSGTSKSQLMRQCALSGPDAQWIKDRVGMTSLEFQALVLGELELVRSRLISELYAKVDKVTPNYLAQSICALSDKILKLHPYASQPDQPTGIRNQVNIQINGSPVNKKQILAELYGNVIDVDSVKDSDSPGKDSVKDSDTGLGEQPCGMKSKVSDDGPDDATTDPDPDTEDEGESDSTENKSTVPDA